MFPGPYATIIRNEAGEPLGWDDHYYDEEPYDDNDYDAVAEVWCEDCQCRHWSDEDCEEPEDAQATST